MGHAGRASVAWLSLSTVGLGGRREFGTYTFQMAPD